MFTFCVVFVVLVFGIARNILLLLQFFFWRGKLFEHSATVHKQWKKYDPKDQFVE